MSLGSVFTLVSNDGKFDKFLNATHLLNDRLRKSAQAKLFACKSNYDKYFNDPNAVYTKAEKEEFYKDPNKFCEERRVKSIHPTLWDITRTHNVFMNQFYKPFAATSHVYFKNSNRKGLQNFDSEVTFSLTKAGSWFADMALHVKLKGLRAVNEPDKCKYAAWLGHRLIKEVKFSINNNELDKYTTEDINDHFMYNVLDNKKEIWARCVGQEIPHRGYITPDPINNEFREVRWISDGPQTLKSKHNDVELVIPLLFWCNKIEQAFPLCMIPWGEIDIKFTLASVSELVDCTNYGGGGEFIPPMIDCLDLYVNYIESLPQIVSVYKNNFDYSLIRIHKQFTQELQVSSNEVWLQELKYPIESLSINFRPLENLESVDCWYLSTKLTEQFVKQPVITDVPVPNTLAVNTIVYHKEEQLVNELSLRIKDVELYPTFPAALYQNYFPYSYGKFINGPTWLGWYLMNFNFFPGDYNPSGHINVSKNREMYLKYRSDFISPECPTRLTVLARTLNFLLIEGGEAILRYST